MLVDLIELYVNSEKLPREAWKQQPRVRGELRISRYFSWRGYDRAPAAASLAPFGLVADLDKVRVTFMWGKNLVLFGDQQVRGRMLEQMWWCKFVDWHYATTIEGMTLTPDAEAALASLTAGDQSADAVVSRALVELARRSSHLFKEQHSGSAVR